MIGIVDYNAGNIRSVESALDALSIPYICSKKPADLEKTDKLIFPGVGDAAYAMQQLHATGFDHFLQDKAAAETPLLGICLGSQIIFDWSEEGDTTCLGLVPGNIRHFNTLFESARLAQSETLKIPHMGWNTLHHKETPFFDNISDDAAFYFVHSYAIDPKDWSIVKGYADYGIKVPAIIEYKTVTAFQFHPEKSGKEGLQLLQNFCIQNGDIPC